MSNASRRMRRHGPLPLVWSPWERVEVPEATWLKYKIDPRTRRAYALRNSHYAVQLGDEHHDGYGMVTHLWIARADKLAIHSWSDLQRIKNECVEDGPRRLAVEVYPTVEALVDVADMYHLWVMPVGFSLPFGLKK